MKECPSPDILFDYVKGKIRGKQKKEILEHTAACLHCVRAISNLYRLCLKERKKIIRIERK